MSGGGIHALNMASLCGVFGDSFSFKGGGVTAVLAGVVTCEIGAFGTSLIIGVCGVVIEAMDTAIVGCGVCDVIIGDLRPQAAYFIVCV